MQTVRLETASTLYKVLIAASVNKLKEYYPFSNAVAVVDNAVKSAWIAANHNIPTHYLDGGESIKSLAEVEILYKKFTELGLDKASTIIAVGGGALTDLVSFAASTFHRGMPCVTVPTTLLAQVDASIGGKNGVNFCGIKNLIGTIVQPKLVLCDLEFLKTLPRHAISSGMAEIIKAAVIADAELFEKLLSSSNQVFSLNNEILEDIITRAVQVKADIVSRDEHESSERMKLNLGHTIGHAIEVEHQLEHGQAVAIGMVLETRLAEMLGICDPSLVGLIQDCCLKYELADRLNFDPERIFSLMLQDKKKRSDRISFALPGSIGQVELFSLKLDEIKKHISNLCLA